tara:strand:+ start:975 stop:1946 length:972 start_codon:yes stop_codon:yes gene_type:complete
MKNVLITGCSGEMGYGLIKDLSSKNENLNILAIDLVGPADNIKRTVSRFIKTDITDVGQIEKVISSGPFDNIYHLAAILSTHAASNMTLAHDVNVNGTLNLLNAIINNSSNERQPKFFFPSSIAVYNTYGINNYKPINESQYCNPSTSYGAHKLYCEQIGNILSIDKKIDFRSIRFPGIISADTTPAGGTSDYGPEMLHAAIKGDAYDCFVEAESQIPFMTMPDAIESISLLMQEKKENLQKAVYNVKGFAPTAKDFEDEILQYFPEFRVSYVPHLGRQRMVDGWPNDIDDSAAKDDWKWQASHNLSLAFAKYLIPQTKKLYK